MYKDIYNQKWELQAHCIELEQDVEKLLRSVQVMRAAADDTAEGMGHFKKAEKAELKGYARACENIQQMVYQILLKSYRREF